VLVASILTVAASVAYLPAIGIRQGEYYALLMLSVAGAILLVGAGDLLSTFIGLELMSIPIYVLSTMDRSNPRSSEAGLKFFLTGMFASAILLYGSALLYGASGSTSYPDIRAALDLSNPFAVIGMGLVIVGLGFKVAAAPFHQWAPDVMDGAPTSVAVYIATVARVAAFAALLRFVASAIGSEILQLSSVFWATSMLSMAIGNAMALVQTDLKRMLAYATIGQTGFLLVGLSVGSENGYAALAFHLVAYVLSVTGAYVVIIALARDREGGTSIEDFEGLARTHPGLAALLSLFLMSLAGIPGTVGFVGKFQLIAASVQVGMVWLPVAIVFSSVAAVFCCARVAISMYANRAMRAPFEGGVASGEAFTLAVCGLMVVALGLLPGRASLPGVPFDWPVLEWAAESVSQFFGA
jgi:NADH-quinone oxidoreductase subunit N